MDATCDDEAELGTTSAGHFPSAADGSSCARCASKLSLAVIQGLLQELRDGGVEGAVDVGHEGSKCDEQLDLWVHGGGQGRRETRCAHVRARTRVTRYAQDVQALCPGALVSKGLQRTNSFPVRLEAPLWLGRNAGVLSQSEHKEELLDEEAEVGRRALLGKGRAFSSSKAMTSCWEASAGSFSGANRCW